MDNDSSARPKTIPEIRGMTSVPRDRQRKYSSASYAAQYGITLDDAEYLVDQCASHPEVERRIHAMFAKDPHLKDRALNWQKYEHERIEQRRRQIEEKRDKARKAIAEAKRQEAERENARKALAKKAKTKKELDKKEESEL